MEQKINKVGELIMVLLLGLMLLTILFSWLASAMGLSVISLLSGEGLRWLFTRCYQCVLHPATLYAFHFVVALGALQYSGFLSSIGDMVHPRRNRMTTMRIKRAFFYGCMMWLAYVVLWAVLLLGSGDTLLSVTGRLYPSPFSAGLPTIFMAGAILSSWAFSYVGGAIRKVRDGVVLFYCGIRIYAVWIMNLWLCLLLDAMITFVF